MVPRVVAAIVIGTFGALAAAVPAFASANSDSGIRCGPATIVEARGTGEPAGVGSTNGGRTYSYNGLGPTLVSFAVAIGNDQEIPVHEEQLLYPAAVWNGVAAPYLSSVAAGVTNLRAEIEDIAATCPYTNILLAGYSQGAQVIGDVLDNQTSPQLSNAAKQHITSVVFYGDPSYRPGEAWDAAGSGTGGGMFQRHAGAFSGYTAYMYATPTSPGPTWVSKIRSYCATGDEFCQNAWPAGDSIHHSYSSTTYGNAGWAFMRNFLIDQG